MTEFAVGAAALSLLLLGSVTLAGYQEVQRRTAISAREIAFRSAWSAGGGDLGFALQTAAQRQILEPGLTETTAGNRYVSPAGIGVTSAAQQAPGLAGTATQLLLDPLQVAGGFLGGGFDLPAGRYTAGTITVDVPQQPDLPEPFRSLSLQFRQPFALQTDAWNAASVHQVRSRAAGLVPSAALSGLQSLWRPLLAPLTLIEPSLGDLCLGLIEPDRIPEDRLGAGRTTLPTGCP
jgi:hypothetical protein